MSEDEKEMVTKILFLIATDFDDRITCHDIKISWGNDIFLGVSQDKN